MTDPLEFTGERFTPECVREIWYEHWHRYAFARSLCVGKRVLDAACGEGYGSNLLAQVARDVVGVDLSPQTIEHARQRYANHANLRFEQADATQLPALGGKFDVIVSFETLEHLHAQDALLAGFANQLADDGMAVVLVEQFAALALAIGNRAYVLRRGQIVYDGGCAALARDPAHLHRLYLGDAAA